MPRDTFCLAGWPEHIDSEGAAALRDDLSAFLSYHDPVAPPVSLVVGDVVRVTERPWYVEMGSRHFLVGDVPRVGELGEVMDGPDGDGDYVVHFTGLGSRDINPACLVRHER